MLVAAAGRAGMQPEAVQRRARPRRLARAMRPQMKRGPALLPAPTAPSEGSAGVRNLVDRTFRLTNPLSILAHQLRRRFPSHRSLSRGARLLLDCASRRFACLSTSGLSLENLNRGTEVPKPKSSGQSRSMFCGPSWGNHSCVPLCSSSSEKPGSRVALEAVSSSGASSRLAPKRTRKFSPLPAGGDRTFGHLPHSSFPCGPSEEAGTAVPIT